MCLQSTLQVSQHQKDDMMTVDGWCVVSTKLVADMMDRGELHCQEVNMTKVGKIGECCTIAP